MWSRKELKDRAKAVLSKIYWSAFGVSIVIALAGGSDGWSGGGGGSNSSSRETREAFYSRLHDNYFSAWSLASVVLVSIIVILLLRILIGYALVVGGRKFFVQSAQYRDNKKCFSFSFKEENYMAIVKTMLLKNVLIFLWSLLLIIPGIIKAYAYSMVPNILADNPNISVTRALELSTEMTAGHKLDMFILDLSFIGWYLLGALALGIGIFFVMPYENATHAELYLILRQEAIDAKMCRSEELLLNQSASEGNNGSWQY
jgi:uncharacterized membrane protein